MISRRNFLAAGLVIPAFTLLPGCFDPVSKSEVSDVTTTRDFLTNIHGGERVGWYYFDDYISQKSIVKIESELFSKLGVESYQSEETISILNERISTAIRKDFENDNLCMVAGWHLSETECLVAYVSNNLRGVSRELAFSEPEKITIENATTAHIVDIDAWGPKQGRVGAPFNEQSDGHSGMWFSAKSAPSSIKVYIDGVEVKTTVGVEFFSVAMYDKEKKSILSSPGIKKVEIFDPVAGVKQEVGDLVFTPPESGDLCQPIAWGPQSTTVGKVFNIQESGYSAFWINISCAPQTTVFIFGDQELSTVVGEGLITARLNEHGILAQPASIPLYLYDKPSGKKLHFGDFVIHGE